MARLLFILMFISLSWTSLLGQTIVYAEYYFNSDPGYGNGTPVSLVPDSILTLSVNPSVTALQEGINLLYVRFQDDQGRWSHSAPSAFRIRKPVDTMASATVAGETFWDADPGFGNGTPITVSSGSPVTIPFTVPITQLTHGRHHLFARFKNAEGLWTHTVSWEVHVRPEPDINTIQTIEYAYDQDSNFAKLPPIAVPALDLLDSNMAMQTTGLPLGEYTLLIRAKDEQGRLSHLYHLPVTVCTTYGPVAAFEPVVNRNRVTFLNNSEYTDSVAWDFGDGNKDSLAFNPEHIYVPGEYTARLEVANACGRDTLEKEIIVPGISHVSPTVHGNDGISLIDVYGAAFDSSSTARLIKAGTPDIEATALNFIDHTHLKPVFKFRGNPVGSYHMIVDGPPGKSDTLFDAITLEPSTGHDLWIDITGPSLLLINREVSMTVVIGNKGNTTAYGVPLFIKAPVSSNVSVKGNLHQDSLPQGVYDSMPHFSEFEDPFVEDTTVFGGFVLPMVRPGEVQSFTFTFQPTQFGTAEITTYLAEPIMEEWQVDSIFRSSCSVLPPCSQCLLDGIGLLPVAGCAVGIFDLGCALIENTTDKGSSGPMDLIGSLGGAILNCTPAGTLTKAFQVAKSAGGALGGGAGVLGSCFGVGGGSGCFGGPKDPQPVNTVGSFDPNIKVGPTGFTSENYTRGDDPMVYTIYFENADTASSPANEVVVIDSLNDSLLDLSSLRFLSFGFGDTSMSVLENRDPAYFVRDIDLRPTQQTIARVIGQLDTATGVLTATYTSLDPDTMKLVDDPFNGFLLPNVNPPEGEGYIQFMINLKPGYQHLDEIENKASIYFDANDPIETPEWTNTIDLQPPSSAVDALPDSILDTVFTVSWAGTDAHAGVMDYDVYVIENDTLEYLWKVGISKTSAEFKGAFGKTYKFYSVARDNAGNEELPPADPVLNPDAETTLLDPTAVRDLADPNQWMRVHPNPANQTAWISWEQSQPADIQISLIDASGLTAYSTEGHYPSGMHHHEVALRNLPTGVYIVRLRVDGRPIYSKVVVYR